MTTTLSPSPIARSAKQPRAGATPTPQPARGDLSQSADPSSPAETTPRAVVSSPAARGDNFATFDDLGDFAAFYACEAWLKERGFTVGPLQGNSPVKAMFAPTEEVKAWKYQSGEDLNDLHVKIMPATLSASMKAGPVKAWLRSTVHSDVAAAFRSDPVDTAARTHVEGSTS